MITDEILEEKKSALTALQNQMSYHLETVSASTMTREDPYNNQSNRNSISDPHSIHYNPPVMTVEDRGSYSLLINRELRLRGVTFFGGMGLAQRREKLRRFLGNEYRLRTMLDEVGKSERPKTALFLLLQAVPCILHLENRVSLKTIEVLLNEGIKNARDGPLYPNVTGKEKKVAAYLDDVERLMNTTVLGRDWNPAQWKCPYDTSSKTLAPIRMENWKARIVLSKLEVLVEASVTVPDRVMRYRRLLPRFRAFMAIARSKTDWNTPEGLSGFQKLVDLWIQDWLFLHAKSGMTNYIHMLCSGHITDYVKHWGNLYEHSQQGWEAFNALLKSFYFRRTSRGGGRARSRLRPIARWLQRRMMWLCGETEESVTKFLDELDNELKNGATVPDNAPLDIDEHPDIVLDDATLAAILGDPAEDMDEILFASM